MSQKKKKGFLLRILENVLLNVLSLSVSSFIFWSYQLYKVTQPTPFNIFWRLLQRSEAWLHLGCYPQIIHNAGKRDLVTWG